MTQEEKAKAYDEALKRVENLENITSEEEAVINYIFPQLRESEDERIRKRIIEILNSLPGCYWYGQKEKDDTLAYLEKQKEQQPILEVFGFKVGDAVRLKDGDGRKHIIKSFEEVEGVHGPNFYHVEFEDNSARDGIYPGEEYPNGYYTQMEKFEEEQKPAEWKLPDDFEEAVYKVANFISPFNSQEELRKVSHRFAEQLLDIAKKDVQKLAEWSEEDKRKLNRIYEILGYAADDKGFLTSKRIIGDKEAIELQDFLKSLRPSWKPSEEQMKELKLIINGKAVIRTDFIRTLYNDLKKLM